MLARTNAAVHKQAGWAGGLNLGWHAASRGRNWREEFVPPAAITQRLPLTAPGISDPPPHLPPPSASRLLPPQPLPAAVPAAQQLPQLRPRLRPVRAPCQPPVRPKGEAQRLQRHRRLLGLRRGTRGLGLLQVGLLRQQLPHQRHHRDLHRVRQEGRRLWQHHRAGQGHLVPRRRQVHQWLLQILGRRLPGVLRRRRPLPRSLRRQVGRVQLPHRHRLVHQVGCPAASAADPARRSCGG